MCGLVKADMVNRRDGKDFLTTFGKIVYKTQTIIEEAFLNCKTRNNKNTKGLE
jgi:hypothetical protein